MEGKCTICFESPFWVGIFERNDDQTYSVARHVFGSEPTDAEIFQFILKEYSRLAFSQPERMESPGEKKLPGYKRRTREAGRQTRETGVGTQAQRAIQAERERMKTIRREETSAERQEQADARFRLKQDRKKQKHRGH